MTLQLKIYSQPYGISFTTTEELDLNVDPDVAHPLGYWITMEPSFPFRGPELDTQTVPQRDHGELLVKGAYRDVDLEIPIWICGTTEANVITALTLLDKLLEVARSYSLDQIGDPILLGLTIDGTAFPWYSQIKYGDVIPSTMEYFHKGFKLPASLIIRREWSWKHSSPQSTVLATIYDHQDGSHNNKVTVTTVKGDLPCLPRLRLLNAVNSAREITKIWVGRFPYYSGSVPTTFSLESESATGATPEVDANCSNGYKETSTWAVDAETQLLSWTISSAEVTKFRGYPHRAILRFAATHAYTDLQLQVRVYSNGVLLEQTPWSYVTSTPLLQDLGLIHIPPYRMSTMSPGAVDVRLYGKRTGGGTIVTDFLYLMPVPDGLRIWTPKSGSGLAYLEGVYERGDDDNLYILTATGEFPEYLRNSPPIWLRPKQTTIFHFLWVLDDNSAPVDHSASVDILYYSRKRHLGGL